MPNHNTRDCPLFWKLNNNATYSITEGQSLDLNDEYKGYALCLFTIAVDNFVNNLLIETVFVRLLGTAFKLDPN